MAIATSARRSTHTIPTTSANLLHLWHLLSLDAPTVATLWTCFIARTAHIQLPLASALAMFLAVWTLYAADRLLDSRQLVSNPLHTHNLEPRHLFHHRHATAFLTAILLSSIALAAILPRIPTEALHLYLILGSFLVAYFVLIHATSSSRRLPKEFAVGLFFAAATFIQTVARRPDLRLPLIPPALLLATLCSLNCLFIYAWEHSPHDTHQTAHLTTRLALRNLPLLATIAILIGLTLTLFDHSAPWPIAAACTLSIALLLTLHIRRNEIPATTLRATADLALLTPALLLPFLTHP